MKKLSISVTNNLNAHLHLVIIRIDSIASKHRGTKRIVTISGLVRFSIFVGPKNLRDVLTFHYSIESTQNQFYYQIFVTTTGFPVEKLRTATYVV